MQAFAVLLERLSLTTSHAARRVLLLDYLKAAPDPDRGLGLALLTGDLKITRAKPAMMRQLAESRIDTELFHLTHEFVGDLAETVSLVWPVRRAANRAPDLSEVVEGLSRATPSDVPALIEAWLDALDIDGRWALLKLSSGAVKIRLPLALVFDALAGWRPERSQMLSPSMLAEVWHATRAPYIGLFDWIEGRGPRPDLAVAGRFRPLMRTRPLDVAADLSGLIPTRYAAEWKWDGLRVQAVREGGVARLYSQTGENLTPAFPDLMRGLTFDGVIDAELAALRDGDAAPFSDLAPRLKPRTLNTRLIADHPVALIAFDLLYAAGADLRDLGFKQRRERLETLVREQADDRLRLSPLISFDDPSQLAALRNSPPAPGLGQTIGLVLKPWDAPYLSGPSDQLWLTWKRAPNRMNAVLLYAQRNGDPTPRTALELTFGLWKDGVLTPVGKALCTLAGEDRKRIEHFIRDHTVERFGPVRRLRAEPDHGLVAAISYEGVQQSRRHKSGITLRAPTLEGLRHDISPAQADTTDSLAHAPSA